MGDQAGAAACRADGAEGIYIDRRCAGETFPDALPLIVNGIELLAGLVGGDLRVGIRGQVIAQSGFIVKAQRVNDRHASEDVWVRVDAHVREEVLRVAVPGELVCKGRTGRKVMAAAAVAHPMILEELLLRGGRGTGVDHDRRGGRGGARGIGGGQRVGERAGGGGGNDNPVIGDATYALIDAQGGGPGDGPGQGQVIAARNGGARSPKIADRGDLR
jgi:hypothetical protein